MSKPRCCTFCCVELVRHDGERPWSFNRRRFCDSAHAAYWRANGGRAAEPGDRRLLARVNVESAPVRFPGARYEHVDDVPPNCSCGGVWRHAPGAIVCALCSKQYYVVELLHEAVHSLGWGGATPDEPTRFLAPYGPGSGGSGQSRKGGV